MNVSTSGPRYAVASISCGRDHTLALLGSGRVFGWGGDGSGRMPLGIPEYCSTATAPARAVEIDTRHPMASISAGHGISVGITVTNRVMVWGANPAAAGGWGSSRALVTPQWLAEMTNVRSIVAGEFLFGAIDDGGAVHTWGLNVDGALGRPTPHLNSRPGTIASIPPASELALGKGYMLALTGGQVHAWGNNAAGQLGLGNLSSISTPRPLPIKTDVRSVAAGATHSLAIASNGAVFAWGSNHHGQLGDKRVAYSPVPLHVDLPERAQSVAAGMHFSLALGVSGRVYAWGWNGQGQLGLGDTTDRFAATPVHGLEQARFIAAGETHAAAVTAHGLYGWGSNAAGQIGAGERRQLRPISILA
jgi:alpha-tubulin suppressor-like RCC1 family protein